MTTVVVNVRSDDYDVYIGRGSKWGNPFKMRNSSEAERTRVIREYALWFMQPAQKHLRDDIESLRGKRLGCYCAPKPCHGHVLVAFLEERRQRFVSTLAECQHNLAYGIYMDPVKLQKWVNEHYNPSFDTDGSLIIEFDDLIEEFYNM